MKNFKNIFILLITFSLLSSCGTIKEGFSMQKKDNTDEFLVEKKNPLKLPPNFDELPIPETDENLNNEEKKKEIKALITQNENNSENSSDDQNLKNKNLEELLLEKIKNN